MADISPFLLEEQKKNLADFPATFLLSDVEDLPEALLQNHDLAILNENVGDFPTAVNLTASVVMGDDSQACGPEMSQIRSLFNCYPFVAPPEDETFNFNLGAVLATEKLCRAKIPFIFISEHSCEASVPADLRDLIPVSATGNPQRIPLKGHDEYTIRFSDLEIVAGHYGYRVQRGPLADFVQPDFNDSLKWLLKRRHSSKDEHEILRQFVEDLYQYEYLLLIRQDDQWERTATMQKDGRLSTFLTDRKARKALRKKPEMTTNGSFRLKCSFGENLIVTDGSTPPNAGKRGGMRCRPPDL